MDPSDIFFLLRKQKANGISRRPGGVSLLLGWLGSTEPRGIFCQPLALLRFLPNYKVATMSLILVTSLFWSLFPRISIPLKNPTMSPTPFLWKNPLRFSQSLHYWANTSNAFCSIVTVFNLCTQLRMQILNLKM